MTNKHSVKKSLRLRRRAGLSPVMSDFERRMAKFLREKRAELERLALRGKRDPR